MSPHSDDSHLRKRVAYWELCKWPNPLGLILRAKSNAAKSLPHCVVLQATMNLSVDPSLAGDEDAKALVVCGLLEQ